MTVLHSVVINGQGDLDRVLAYLKEHAPRLAKEGSPLQVNFSKWHQKRSLSQNAWMWSHMLERFAQEAQVNGVRFIAKIWNEHLKEEHLPDQCARGVPKWTYKPDGSRCLLMSTSDLDLPEMTAYLDRCKAYGAVEFGIVWD